jgi:NADH dehydrogenase/NADH:ubiquinone oxidoreductase subunit G
MQVSRVADDLQRQVNAIERLKKAQQGCEWAEADWQDAVEEAKAAGIAHQKIVEIEGITDQKAMLERLQELQRDA